VSAYPDCFKWAPETLGILNLIFTGLENFQQFPMNSSDCVKPFGTFFVKLTKTYLSFIFIPAFLLRRAAGKAEKINISVL